MNALLANIIIGTYAGNRFSRLGEGPTLEAKELRALRMELAAQHGIKIPPFEEEAELALANRPAPAPSALMEWNSNLTPLRVRDWVALVIFVAVVLAIAVWGLLSQ